MSSPVQDTPEKRFSWVLSFMAMTDPFSYDILQMAKHYPTDKVPTMAVGIDKMELALWYNPEFIATLTDPELTFVLRHEVMHVVLHHVTVRQALDPKEQQLANIAMDLAINCLIPESSECQIPRYKEVVVNEVTGEVIHRIGDPMGCFPKDEGFESRLSYEAYMDLLRKKYPPQKAQEGQGDGASGDGASGGGQGKDDKGQGKGGIGDIPTFDDHGKFAEASIVDEQIRTQIEITQKSKRWGSVPGDVQELIKQAQITEVPWWALLKHEMGKFYSSRRESTAKRPNRKYGYPYFGYKRSSQDAVLALIDVSASVDSFGLSKFAAEGAILSKYVQTFLAEFDTEVKGTKPKKMRKRDWRELEVLGRGGTCFQAAIDYAQEQKFSKIIMFTDGEAPIPDLHGKRMDILWVITPDGDQESKEKYPGRVVFMKKKRQY